MRRQICGKLYWYFHFLEPLQVSTFSITRHLLGRYWKEGFLPCRVLSNEPKGIPWCFDDLYGSWPNCLTWLFHHALLISFLLNRLFDRKVLHLCSYNLDSSHFQLFAISALSLLRFGRCYQICSNSKHFYLWSQEADILRFCLANLIFPLFFQVFAYLNLNWSWVLQD